MRISIITINYNNRQGLQKTIDSVLQQSFRDYEWIVIDGGSQDGSRQLIEENKSHFAYCVSEPDKGIYNAMNKGLYHAKGDYVFFLNSGDVIAANDVLAQVLPCLTTDIVVGYVKSHGQIAGLRHADFSVADLYNYSFPHQASFIRQDLFTRFGVYDEQWRIVADWAFFIDAIVFGRTEVSFIPLNVSEIQDDGLSSDTVNRNAEAQRLREQKFGPLWQNDLQNALSLKEVLSHPFTKHLYALIYRLRTLLK